MCDSCVDGVWHSFSCLFVSCGAFLETGVPWGLACLLPLVASEALNPTGWGVSVAAGLGFKSSRRIRGCSHGEDPNTLVGVIGYKLLYTYRNLLTALLPKSLSRYW